jgi:thiosulfate/3-mercaptopyruvate sulfurtransferase
LKDSIKPYTTNEILNYLNHTNTQIIDLRPVDAYNGWRIRNEKRGGHIKGARSLPFKWASYIDWIEIVRSKNILPDQKIILYSYDDFENKLVAERFIRSGYYDVGIYNNFVSDWAGDNKLPMNRLYRYQNLVYPEWLKALIEDKKPPYYYGKNFIICHVHYRNYDDYLEGHIPGAIALDTLELESPETWNRRSPEELEKALLNKGITKDSTVVLYGRFSFPHKDDPFPGSSAGHLGAMRCAAIMIYAGVKDVKILNGGLQSWEDEGYTVSSEVVHIEPEEFFGAEIPVNPDLMIDTREAKELISSKDGDIVSIRSWMEWIGEVSGYNYIEKKGRIPGAIFGNCGTDAYHMENYRNLDHTMREFQETEQIWTNAGIKPDKKLAFYCGTGWRGSEAFINAYLIGWPNVAVYDGGWFEWSADPENPIETGMP